MEGDCHATIKMGSQPFGLDFHPSQNCVLAGLISGAVELFQYSSERSAANALQPPRRIWESHVHQESCRAVQFLGSNEMVSVSADKSIALIDASSGRISRRTSSAHNAGVNCLATISDNAFATGDDEGTIKVWDSRQSESVSTFSAHEDFVSDIVHEEPSMNLLSTSGDGTLSVIDLRQKKIEAQSEYAEDELLSVACIKNRRKVVCGTQTGVLVIYSWGHFEDCSDRFPGHPSSVDTLVKVDEDTLLTGSSDGLIRILSIHPNKMLGVVGEHSDDPIERLAVSFDGKFLASASHDNTVKLWDISFLTEDEEVEETGDKAENDGGEKGKEEADSQGGGGGEGGGGGDESGEGESDSDSDKASGSKKRKKGRKAKSQFVNKKRPNDDFFADI